MLRYGNWKEVCPIGHGSFGTVYEIEQVDEFGFTTKAALKVIRIPQSNMQIEELRSEGQTEDRIAEYFREMTEKVMNEVHLMYNLKGEPNIVGYLDHEIRLLDDGISREILIRMELLTPLRQYTLNHKITRRDVIKLGIDICHALERCQKLNIIHRDIKPGNILVTKQGDYKLSDFGIARKVSEDETMASMSQKGTYSYMAPEVYLGKQYGYSVDLYSLGIVMYQLLNYNRDPFLPVYPNPIHHGDRKKSHLQRMKGEPFPLPAQDNGRLAEIILKACSYDAKDRYSSPKQMLEDLESILYSDQMLDKFLDKKYNDIEVPSSEISITGSSLEIAILSSDSDKKKEKLLEDETYLLWENRKEQNEEWGKSEEKHKELVEIEPDLSIENDNNIVNIDKGELKNKIFAWMLLGVFAVILIIFLPGKSNVPHVTDITDITEIIEITEEKNQEKETQLSSEEAKKKEEEKQRLIEEKQQLIREQQRLAEEERKKEEEKQRLAEEERKKEEAELEELLKDIYEKMKAENYEELYKKVKKFTVFTPGFLDTNFYFNNELVTESLESGVGAIKAYGHYRSNEYENGYQVYYGVIKNSMPNGWGTLFRCEGLDEDDNGSREYMVIKGEWIDGVAQGKLTVYHSKYSKNYEVTFKGNVTDELWDGDITMIWENLSTGVSDFAIIHATNGTFPIIRQEGTKCIYAESSTGFYWYVDNAESLTERSIYK